MNVRKVVFPDNLEDYAPWVAMFGLVEPYGKCQCGCGEDAGISQYNNKEKSWRANHPKAYVFGHGQRRGRNLEEAFWIMQSPGDPDECWEWQHFTEDGYGRFFYRGKVYRSHRVSYQIHFGSIPDGMYVCHRCDNRACTNPAHLFLGTHDDNMRDMFSKGRNHIHSGESHPQAKLTEKQVLSIRRYRAAGEKLIDVAARFGISLTTVSDIANRKIWAHLE